VPNWKLVVVVTLGGGLGSAARLLLGAFVQERLPLDFPAGTLLINIIGSFLIGLIMQVGVDTRVFSPEARFFLTTGLCGGFTTFSTFSYETIQLFEDDRYAAAAAYIAASVLLSIAACVLGVASARGMLAWRKT
jgi:fluoride exporter